jgi:hypothetical protein
MFTTPITTDAIRHQYHDRLNESASRHRRIFGRRHRDDVIPSLAPIVALPTRVDRTSPRDSRVA